MIKHRVSIYFGKSINEAFSKSILPGISWPFGFLIFDTDRLEYGYFDQTRKITYEIIVSIRLGINGYVKVATDNQENFGFFSPNISEVLNAFDKKGVEIINRKKLVRISTILTIIPLLIVLVFALIAIISILT